MERIRATQFGVVTRVLSLGVGTFDDSAIEPLRATEREAGAFAAALADPEGCAIPLGQIKVVTGRVAARVALAEIQRAATECSEQSVLIIYFSGHGFRDETGVYLCGTDAKKSDLRSTCVSSLEIEEALSSCVARGVLLILDCCVSAGFAENAPAFFRRTHGSDFRILLAASRENERSWEVGNGEGTLFSRHLINIVAGKTPVGMRSGEISLIDLVDGLDFHVNEDLTSLHPEVPLQQPIVAGSFSRDPVLFFHKSLALAGLTVERDRVSRALHKRVIRSLIVSGIVAVAFGTLTYLSWLDKHLYATADSNMVRIYRGYPGWGGPGFPKLVWEEPISSTAFRSDSPLKKGKALVAPLDRPIEPVLGSQFNVVASLSESRRMGNSEEVRKRLLPLLDEQDLPAETSIFARLLLADVATSADLPRLRALLKDPRPEIRTNSVRGILRVAPTEAFELLTNALSDFDQFDQRALINEIPLPCPRGGDAYFNAATRAAGFNGVYEQLTDSAIRAGCHISHDGLEAMAKLWPERELQDLANYGVIFHEPIRGNALEERGDVSRRAFLDVANVCHVESARWNIAGAADSVMRQDVGLLLLSPACLHNGLVGVGLGSDGSLEITAKGTSLSLTISPSLRPGVGTSLIRLLEERGDSISVTFLEEIARGNPDDNMKADALEALLRKEHPFRPAQAQLNSGNLELRRAAYAALAEIDHTVAFESLRSRINDQDLLDWPELTFAVHPTGANLETIRPFLLGGARERERAASIFAIFGNEEDIEKLTSDSSYDVRQAVEQYIGANRKLPQFHLKQKVRTFDDFDAIVSSAQRKRLNLQKELDSVPVSLRGWRIRQILTWRGNSFDTSFRQVLQPGLKLWLAGQIQ